MKRIFAIVFIGLFAFMLFLLVYTPAQDYLRTALGPSITGAFDSTILSITGSPQWIYVASHPSWVFVIGCGAGGAVMFITYYLYHSGTHRLWRFGRKQLDQEAGTYGTGGEPTVTVDHKTPKPVATKKTEKPEPTVEDEAAKA